MLLAARTRTTLLAAATAIAARSAIAAEPTPTKAECIAASESGQDLRRTGKLHDARAQFAICAAASCPGPISDDCAQRLDEIARSIPSIVFVVTDSVGNDVPSVVITTNGQPVAGPGIAAGTAVELDPGEHTLSFQARGLTRIEKRLVLVEGEKQRREVVIMDRAETVQTAKTASPPAAETSTRSGRPPAATWAAFGVGGAGITLGVIAGLVAGGKHSTLESECNNTAGTCAPAYTTELHTFHTWRTVSTAGYIVGAIGIASGAVLLLTTPKAHDATATGLWLGPASAGIAGRF